jgi:hypothetical protein
MINELIKNKKGAGGLSGYVMGILIIIVFVTALLYFSGLFISSSNPTNPLITTPKYAFNSTITSLSSTMTNFTNVVNSTQYTLANSHSEATTYLFLIFKGAFDIPLAILGFIKSGVVAMNTFFIGATGGNGFLGTLLSLIVGALGLVGIFYIVKAIRTGETEY